MDIEGTFWCIRKKSFHKVSMNIFEIREEDENTMKQDFKKKSLLDINASFEHVNSDIALNPVFSSVIIIHS